LTPAYWPSFVEAKKRGVRIRYVVEITKDNLAFCKEMMKIIEVKHLDGIKGNFGITDGKEYGAAAMLQEKQPIRQLIYSNARQVVEQYQYLFETLWKSGMDASERIRQLEQGVGLAKIETLTFEQSVCNGGELVKSGKSIDIPFSSARTFEKGLEMELAQLYKVAVEQNKARIRVLTPSGDGLSQKVARLKTEIPEVQVRVASRSLQTRISIMLTDNNSEPMIWEDLRESNETPITIQQQGLLSHIAAANQLLRQSARYLTHYGRKPSFTIRE
jgi:two-component system sensor histidine kinase VicK